jgi:hypothetical protein
MADDYAGRQVELVFIHTARLSMAELFQMDGY